MVRQFPFPHPVPGRDWPQCKYDSCPMSGEKDRYVETTRMDTFYCRMRIHWIDRNCVLWDPFWFWNEQNVILSILLLMKNCVPRLPRSHRLNFFHVSSSVFRIAQSLFFWELIFSMFCYSYTRIRIDRIVPEWENVPYESLAFCYYIFMAIGILFSISRMLDSESFVKNIGKCVISGFNWQRKFISNFRSDNLTCFKVSQWIKTSCLCIAFYLHCHLNFFNFHIFFYGRARMGVKANQVMEDIQSRSPKDLFSICTVEDL